MTRLLGAVFGLAATGALFEALENNRLFGLLATAGADLDASDRTEVRGLLSGSEAAETKLAKLAPEAAEQVERVVREEFVFALDGAMLLCMVGCPWWSFWRPYWWLERHLDPRRPANLALGNVPGAPREPGAAQQIGHALS
jgi:hypothetical protein